MGEYIRCADPLCEEEVNLRAITNIELGELVSQMLVEPSTNDRGEGWRASLMDYVIRFYCPTCWLDVSNE